jgi:O-antigen/teichoic acid export membrane protein
MTEPALPSPVAAEQAATQAQEDRVSGAIRGSMLWNLVNTVFSQVSTIAIFILLTFQLEPVVFGVFALAVVFVDFFWVNARSAALDATLQKNRFDQQSLNSIFLTLLALFAGVACVLSILGFVLSRMMHEPQLTGVMIALALLLVPLGLAVPGEAALMRDHQFKDIAIRNSAAAIGGGLLALAVAFSNWPEWALVAQRFGQLVIATVFILMRTPWRPGLSFDLQFAASFFKATSRIFVAQSLSASYLRVIDIVVASSFGTAVLGVLRVAARLIDAVYGAFASPVSSLWVILLSAGNKTAEERRHIFLSLTKMSSLICVPVFVGLALIANDLIFLLDKDYTDSGPFLTILSIAGIFAPLAYFRNAGFIAIKRHNLLILLSSLDLLLVFVLGTYMTRYSVAHVVSVLVVLEALKALLAAIVLSKAMVTPKRALILTMLPAYLAGTAMAIAGLGLQRLVHDQPAMLQLALIVPVCALTYIGYVWLAHRDWAISALNVLLKRPAAAAESNASEVRPETV